MKQKCTNSRRYSEKTHKEVGEKGAKFIKMVNKGIALTKEGTAKYLAKVTTALKGDG